MEGVREVQPPRVVLLQVTGLEIRRFFMIQLVATDGATQVLRFHVL